MTDNETRTDRNMSRALAAVSVKLHLVDKRTNAQSQKTNGRNRHILDKFVGGKTTHAE